MISVRGMQKKDIERVYEIENLSFRSPWSKQSLSGELKNNLAHYLVAETEDGQIAGYGGMWVLFDEAHITNIAIHPDHRGNGYSRILMLGLMREALLYDASQMTLEVREHNLVAQNLYTSLSFDVQGRRKKYYSDTGEDALLMWNREIRQTVDNNACIFNAGTLK